MNKCVCETGEEFDYGNNMIAEIKGNILSIDYHNCACGSFNDEVVMSYCYLCGRKLESKTISNHDTFDLVFESSSNNISYSTVHKLREVYGQRKLISDDLINELDYEAGNNDTYVQREREIRLLTYWEYLYLKKDIMKEIGCNLLYKRDIMKLIDDIYYASEEFLLANVCLTINNVTGSLTDVYCYASRIKRVETISEYMVEWIMKQSLTNKVTVKGFINKEYVDILLRGIDKDINRYSNPEESLIGPQLKEKLKELMSND